MHPYATQTGPHPGHNPGPQAGAGGLIARLSGALARAEAWLDARGRPAWIAAMVLSFIFVWPLGLALLAYMIWSKRMFGCSSRRRNAEGAGQSAGFGRRYGAPFAGRGHGAFRSSGNMAFDAYKADTLDRLEREQAEFETFLRRLRESKDKAEFDAYMDARARAHTAAPPAADPHETALPDAEKEA